MASPGLRMQRRIYRALLVLQPRRFRRAYGEQMLQLFTDQLRQSPSASRVWGSAFRDLAVSVSYERLEESMRSSFAVVLGGGVLVMVGLVGVMAGRRGGGLAVPAAGIGLIILAVMGTAFMLRRAANQPSALAVEGGEVASHSRSLMSYLKWLAVPIAVPGLIFAFYGLTWGVAAFGGVAAGLFVVSGLIWRVFDRVR